VVLIRADESWSELMRAAQSCSELLDAEAAASPRARAWRGYPGRHDERREGRGGKWCARDGCAAELVAAAVRHGCDMGLRGIGRRKRIGPHRSVMLNHDERRDAASAINARESQAMIDTDEMMSHTGPHHVRRGQGESCIGGRGEEEGCARSTLAARVVTDARERISRARSESGGITVCLSPWGSPVSVHKRD